MLDVVPSVMCIHDEDGDCTLQSSVLQCEIFTLDLLSYKELLLMDLLQCAVERLITCIKVFLVD